MKEKDNKPNSWADLAFWSSEKWGFVEEQITLHGATSPTLDKIFRSLILTPLHQVSVVIVGQDPYADPGLATGLAFSIPKSCMKWPPTLRNIFQELYDDLKITTVHGDLTSWAKQGVLLLNRYLTCRQHQSLSHADIGWEALTNEIIQVVSLVRPDTVFALWGKEAQETKELLDWTAQVIESSHPSPLSAASGKTPFMGSRPFSAINAKLHDTGQRRIDWRLP